MPASIRPGDRTVFPYDVDIPTVSSNISLGSAQLLDGNTEWLAWVFDAEEAKEIASILMRFGSITTGNANNKVELRNQDSASGHPVRPGSTLHASLTHDATAGGLANTAQLLTFGTPYTPAAMGQPLTLKYGDPGSGTITMNVIPTLDKHALGYPYVVTSLPGIGVRQNMLLFGVKYSDGTWMRIPWCWPCATTPIGTTAFNVNSTDNEQGAKLVLRESKLVDTIVGFWDMDAGDACEARIYDKDRNLIASVAITGERSSTVTYGPRRYRLGSIVPMRAGKPYYVVLYATSTTSIDLQWADAYELAAMDAFLGNQDCCYVRRNITGNPAYTETTTRKACLGVEGISMGK